MASAGARDDAAARCVDPIAPDARWSEGAQDALMHGIARLGSCANSKPENVLVSIRFAPDGTAERVLIERASTKDCKALECVRRELASVKAPAIEGGSRYFGADFVLRRQPAPDGMEKVQWDTRSDSELCIDSKPSEPGAVPESLGKDDARRILRGSAGRIRRCYEAGLARDLKLRGRVVFSLGIDGAGEVVDVRVRSSQIPDCEVSACVKDELRRVTFPKSRTWTSIEVPFDFEPEQSVE